LRAAIFGGEMLPGARLTEDAVAAQAQVSKSTVREALRILARDGLVKLVPMSGARVTLLELRDVREISEARLALETFAARVVSVGSDVALPESERSLERLTRAVRERRWVEIIDADISVHRSIIAATQNSRLRQFWDELETQIRLYLSYHAEDAYDLDHVVGAHQALLAAVRSRDPERAAAAFRDELIRRADVRLALWKRAGRR
jgi:DNA-binding GntR family transcriptional regulator